MTDKDIYDPADALPRLGTSLKLFVQFFEQLLSFLELTYDLLIVGAASVVHG